MFRHSCKPDQKFHKRIVNSLGKKKVKVKDKRFGYGISVSSMQSGDAMQIVNSHACNEYLTKETGTEFKLITIEFYLIQYSIVFCVHNTQDYNGIGILHSFIIYSAVVGKCSSV